MLNGGMVQDRHEIIHLKSTSTERSMYYYPIELELRLISFIKTGDREQVNALQKELYEENFKNRYLSYSMRLQLIFSMKGTIFRVLEKADTNVDLRDKISAIERADTIENMFNCLSNIHMAICTIMKNRPKIESGNFRAELIKYLNTCYMHPELNLYQVSVYFDVSETYAYQFFKEHIGVSFADYLENVRIKKACELLANPNNAVKAVAQQVGYGSDSSFRRAFKRIMGLPPTQYGIVVK